MFTGAIIGYSFVRRLGKYLHGSYADALQVSDKVSSIEIHGKSGGGILNLEETLDQLQDSIFDFVIVDSGKQII